MTEIPKDLPYPAIYPQPHQGEWQDNVPFYGIIGWYTQKCHTAYRDHMPTSYRDITIGFSGQFKVSPGPYLKNCLEGFIADPRGMALIEGIWKTDPQTGKEVLAFRKRYLDYVSIVGGNKTPLLYRLEEEEDNWWTGGYIPDSEKDPLPPLETAFDILMRPQAEFNKRTRVRCKVNLLEPDAFGIVSNPPNRSYTHLKHLGLFPNRNEF